MKHVLVDMHRLKHNPYNGLYIFSKELGNHLADVHPADMQLHFYVPTSDFGIFGKNVLYEGHNSLDKYFKIGTGKFDVWHITTTISWYRPFNKRVKIVYTIHDLHFLIEHKHDLKRNNRMLNLIRKRAERADYIVAISKFSLDTANELLPIANKPQRVIYNGCSCTDNKMIRDPRYIPKRPFLFTVGQVLPRKNFHVLPSLLLDNDYELVIAGLNHFDYSAKVMEAAQKIGVADRVFLIGPVSEEEKNWYYKNCLAFVFPSHAEGFGLPVIEAMQYGKPVFLSMETCLPEIGGDVVYYFKNFDPDDMRRQFIKGMHHYQQTQPQQLIKDRATLFSWDKAAKQYIDVYRELL